METHKIVPGTILNTYVSFPTALRLDALRLDALRLDDCITQEEEEEEAWYIIHHLVSTNISTIPIYPDKR